MSNNWYDNDDDDEYDAMEIEYANPRYKYNLYDYLGEHIDSVYSYSTYWPAVNLDGYTADIKELLQFKEINKDKTKNLYKIDLKIYKFIILNPKYKEYKFMRVLTVNNNQGESSEQI